MGGCRRATQKLLPPAQQAARSQNRGRQFFTPLHQIGQRDDLTAFDPVEQTEIGRGEQPDVVGVLAVDALEAFSDHQLHTGQFFCGGAVFAR